MNDIREVLKQKLQNYLSELNDTILKEDSNALWNTGTLEEGYHGFTIYYMPRTPVLKIDWNKPLDKRPIQKTNTQESQS